MHVTLFFFFLTWFFISSSVCAVELSVDRVADITAETMADKGAGKTEAISKQNDTEQKTQWVVGIGLGVFDYHLYPGAKESKRWVLPVPYFTYRSPGFEIDRGIKSFLYNSKTIVIDISADFVLPVDSDDTRARLGMPDLDLSLQLGPSVEFLLNDKASNYFDVRFEIPLRGAYAIGSRNVEQIGYLIEPRISFNHRRSGKTGFSQKGTIGLKFATRDYHAYYYDVAEEFSTAARSAFESDAGFGGSFAKYRISYKTSDFVYWGFIRLQSLRSAVFENSPLVVQKDYYFVGVGFSWIFAQSL